MGSKDKKVFVKERKWLNDKDHSDNGWISYSVIDYHGVDAEFMIADCSRTITLNFSPYSAKDWDNHAKKLDILISSLNEFRRAMSSAWEDSGNSKRSMFGDILTDMDDEEDDDE